jgi:hypothetical protein
MLGKFVIVSSLAALVLIAAVSISCGGSSSNKTTACTDGPFNIVGDWQITVADTGGDTTTGFGAIDSTGLALFFDATGDTLQLPTLTGACAFSGSLTAYAEPNSGLPSPVTVSVTGNVTSDSAITGTFSGGNSGTISAASFSPLTGSATALSGPMLGEIPGIDDFLFLDLSPTTGNNMSFAGDDSLGCTISGTATQVGTSNVFDISYSYSGGEGCTASTSTGIGFESDTDYYGFNDSQATTYFYADILAASGPFVVEMFSGCRECAHAKPVARHSGRFPMLLRAK